MRFFNTAGPCRPDLHYMLPAANRLSAARRLIEQQAYFVLHAPRQSGKTTAILDLARELTASGRYVAVMLSMECGASFRVDPAKAESAILAGWRRSVQARLPAELHPPPWPSGQNGQLGAALAAWSLTAQRPLVLFLDEIDTLQDDTLIAVLRQLRDGYSDRPQHFPSSVALVGLRDVRDYKVASGGSERLHTSSPFNIKLESLTLPEFTEQDVAALYGQHTAETGQVFSPAALARAFELTQGQPWLVNALARQVVEFLVTDRRVTIDAAHIDEAKERLIARQDTHLDSLAERLREPRVRAIIEPILAGTQFGDVPTDDLRFVVDLGLCRRDPRGGLTIANPIYREVLPRVLADTPMASLPIIHATWLRADGRLDAAALLDAFLVFWRQHGQPLLQSVHYHEIAPHLVLMAFLHRVANGGGTLEREYAVGSGRMDICLRYGPDTLAMELKVWRAGRPDPLPQALPQLDGYLSRLGLTTGWLVIFDQRPGLPDISERTSVESATTATGRAITVIRA